MFGLDQSHYLFKDSIITSIQKSSQKQHTINLSPFRVLGQNFVFVCFGVPLPFDEAESSGSPLSQNTKFNSGLFLLFKVCQCWRAVALRFLFYSLRLITPEEGLVLALNLLGRKGSTLPN